MFYLYIFEPIEDTNKCYCRCYDKPFRSLESAKKRLGNCEGYIVKGHCEKPVYVAIKGV